MIVCRRIRRSFAVAGLILAASVRILGGQAPTAKYADVAEAIRMAGLRDEYAYTLLERLTSAAGPRSYGHSSGIQVLPILLPAE
jgi:hypothetical protein